MGNTEPLREKVTIKKFSENSFRLENDNVTLKIKSKHGLVYIEEIKNGRINAAVYEANCSKRYHYTIKTKKLKKVS